MSCHSSRQNLETQGIRSQSGSFILVIGSEKADLDAASALPLPGIFTRLEIQQKIYY